MIGASLSAEAFTRNDRERFSGNVRMPAGHSHAVLGDCKALLVWPRGLVAGPSINAPSDQWLVLLAGQLHNRRALANELGVGEADAAAVYGAALRRWGDQVDEYCIGHYAAIALAPDQTFLRLARSPFQAPPLHFRQDGRLATIAQHARTLFWRDQTRPQPDLERVGQALVNDASDRFRSWYRGAHRIPLGCAVRLELEGWDEVWRYDLFSRPQVRLPNAAAYVETARALLDEGVAAALEGSSRPAIMLSGGLDSPMVAASALRAMPPGRLLNSYTFGPDPAWQPGTPDGIFVSDFGLVREFAAQHPQLVPHFETNAGRDWRYRQRELLEATDGAPAMLGLAWIEHALHEAATAAGCDAMLCATWGNFGFSSRGPWAFSEYLLRGRWQQLRQALRHRSGDTRSMWRRLVGLSLAPLLPRPLWQQGRQLFGARHDRLAPVAVRADWAVLESTLERSRSAGYDFERLQFASKRAHWQALLAEDGQEQDQYVLGMELLHGIPRRDPTAYRPLVEFCWGCPTDLFMRSGTDRWLARQMAEGDLPDSLRLNRDYGHHYTDWQARLEPACADYIAELELMTGDPDITGLIDLPRLRDLIENLPDSATEYDPAQALPYQTALPIGIAAARFIAYAKGRNDI